MITGGLRAAKDGRRVEVSNNQIRSYNDSGELHGLATNNASNFGDIEFYDDDNLVFRIYNRTQGGGVSLIPENEASLVVGKEGHALGLNGSIVLNGIVVPSITSKNSRSDLWNYRTTDVTRIT